jgi:predicted RNA-binding protein
LVIRVQRWLCISTRANDEVTRKKLVWGVAKRYQNTITRVKKGDTLVMYTMQEIVDREIIPSAVTGIYEASSEVYDDECPIFVTPKALGSEVFPLRIKVKPVKTFKGPIPFKPLVPKMTFIKNKTMWSGAIRTAMRMIPEEDFQTIVCNCSLSIISIIILQNFRK